MGKFKLFDNYQPIFPKLEEEAIPLTLTDEEKEELESRNKNLKYFSAKDLMRLYKIRKKRPDLDYMFNTTDAEGNEIHRDRVYLKPVREIETAENVARKTSKLYPIIKEIFESKGWEIISYLDGLVMPPGGKQAMKIGRALNRKFPETKEPNYKSPIKDANVPLLQAYQEEKDLIKTGTAEFKDPLVVITRNYYDIANLYHTKPINKDSCLRFATRLAPEIGNTPMEGNCKYLPQMIGAILGAAIVDRAEYEEAKAEKGKIANILANPKARFAICPYMGSSDRGSEPYMTHLAGQVYYVAADIDGTGFKPRGYNDTEPGKIFHETVVKWLREKQGPMPPGVWVPFPGVYNHNEWEEEIKIPGASFETLLFNLESKFDVEMTGHVLEALKEVVTEQEKLTLNPKHISSIQTKTYKDDGTLVTFRNGNVWLFFDDGNVLLSLAKEKVQERIKTEGAGIFPADKIKQAIILPQFKKYFMANYPKYLELLKQKPAEIGVSGVETKLDELIYQGNIIHERDFIFNLLVKEDDLVENISSIWGDEVFTTIASDSPESVDIPKLSEGVIQDYGDASTVISTAKPPKYMQSDGGIYAIKMK